MWDKANYISVLGNKCLHESWLGSALAWCVVVVVAGSSGISSLVAAMAQAGLSDIFSAVGIVLSRFFTRFRMLNNFTQSMQQRGIT